MTYKTEYDVFMSEYRSGTTDAEAVGLIIAKMAQYFAEFNKQSVGLEMAFNRKAAEIETAIDPDTGKSLSSARAKIIASASPELGAFLDVNADLKNIEQYINALKYLQRGVLQEYSQAGI